MSCYALPGLSRRRLDSSRIVGETLTTPATELPVTVDEARKQIEYPVEDTSHDQHLERLIRAATKFVEDQTYRQLVTATWTFRYDQFPEGRSPIYVPRAPLQSVTSIAYLDAVGASQTLASTEYVVSTDRNPGRISLAADGSGSWPTTFCEGEPITVVAVCGFGAQAAVPFDVKQVILFLVDEWFNRRSGNAEGATKNTYVQNILESLRLGDDYLNYAPGRGDHGDEGGY